MMPMVPTIYFSKMKPSALMHLSIMDLNLCTANTRLGSDILAHSCSTKAMRALRLGWPLAEALTSTRVQTW